MNTEDDKSDTSEKYSGIFIPYLFMIHMDLLVLLFWTSKYS